MSDQVIDEDADAARLIEEISRLRALVAQLETRVEQLDELAHQDSLIQLPNRRGFMRELERLVDRGNRYGHSAAMLYVDLDGLKMINDTFGHLAGDEALIQVAQLLSGGVRRSDIVARIGGDEFAILLENANEAIAQETAARLENMVCDCDFTHDGDVLPLSVAIGVAMIDGDDTPQSVMDRADEEMYRRKDAA
ncbi:GGDEF domain-containing protein [Sphingomonas lutea]|uniref:diguanylate cyclase n=1 Tax=Sphingomonas lutea TaxID=1045317 RepID=A0A7G9SJ06_9SPHN|nr:GGDEF domain-containing protein [Sphingomonas lutea]QNN67831.1 GGDEF domain-containing protein [Sphingomonas lutea]